MASIISKHIVRLPDAFLLLAAKVISFYRKGMAARKNDHLLATKGDIRAVHESIDQVLAVVINIDKKFTGKIREHETRIQRIETKTR